MGAQSPVSIAQRVLCSQFDRNWGRVPNDCTSGGILLKYNANYRIQCQNLCLQYPNVIGRRPARVVFIVGVRGSTLESPEFLGI